jgi:hypothetical protein
VILSAIPTEAYGLRREEDQQQLFRPKALRQRLILFPRMVAVATSLPSAESDGVVADGWLGRRLHILAPSMA